MFNLQQILGKKDQFFDLLEASAREACTSVQALSKFLENSDQLKTLDEFILSRRKEKRIADEISDALCTTFVTALEREDIEALSVSLYKIPKTVEKIAERILLAPQLLKNVDITRQIVILDKSTQTLLTMLQSMRSGGNLENIRSHNERLQVLEGEADKLMLELLKDLYNSNSDSVQVVFLKDVFELLEKVADRCRDAGNVISHIVLKNS
ncbi:MAG: DUF47 family protein [Verrucomicrobia bacterium]|jgi:uncharacterized protein Yka (UPF0111/DUF47 family)|nr:MAG: DUF47 family protein [Verrucomicrobiota bacterium]MCX6881540.1 DUF47 family protein [Verrucomicrobiota bacterium]MSU03616.1 DUF47 family protein [Pedosphaera sp.]